MHRQGIEQLVGEDHARRRHGIEWLEVAAQAGFGKPGCQGVEPSRGDVDRLVRDGVEQRRTGAPEAVEDPRRERAGPGAMLADDKARRSVDRGPHGLEVARDRPAEDRVALRGRQEVAVAAGTRRTAGIGSAARCNSRPPGRTARAP